MTYEDLFLEGYYDALNEIEEDSYDEYEAYNEEDLEEAYLEGYYTALDESNKVNRAKRRAMEVANAKKENMIHGMGRGVYLRDNDINDKRPLGAHQYMTKKNVDDQDVAYYRNKKGNPMSFKFPTTIGQYNRAAVMQKNRQLARQDMDKDLGPSDKVKYALAAGRRKGTVHRGLNDPKTRVSIQTRNKGIKKGFGDL